MTPNERNLLARQYVEYLKKNPPAELFDDLVCHLEDLPKEEPEVGQLWRVSKEESGYNQALIVITHLSENIRGVLAIEDAWLATSDDVIVSERESPIGKEFMIAMWSDISLSRTALNSYIGRIPAQIIKPIRMILQSRLTGGFKLRAVEELQWEGLGAIRWTIEPLGAKRGEVSDFITGTRVVDMDDGRLAVREMLRGATEWIEQDALAESLGLRNGLEQHEEKESRLLDRFLAGLKQLGDSVFGELPSFGKVCDGMPFANLSEGVVGAVRNLENKKMSDSLKFNVMLDELSIEVKLQTTKEKISIMIIATQEGKPKKGVLLSLRELDKDNPKHEHRRTGKEGLAYISDYLVSEDVDLQLTLGEGKSRHVIRI